MEQTNNKAEQASEQGTPKTAAIVRRCDFCSLNDMRKFSCGCRISFMGSTSTGEDDWPAEKYPDGCPIYLAHEGVIALPKHECASCPQKCGKEELTWIPKKHKYGCPSLIRNHR